MTESPPELSNSIPNSVALKASLFEGAVAKAELRPEMRAIKPPIGLMVLSHSRYSIQIGQLEDRLLNEDWSDEYREEIRSHWNGYQQYAAIARTWLLGSQGDDLNLFLLGPVGSKDDPEWQNYGQVIERNDLVCRKSVWLPSQTANNWEAEATDFLSRSFLAKPWARSQKVGQPSLDALSGYGDEFEKWREILDRPEFAGENRDYDLLVAELLRGSV